MATFGCSKKHNLETFLVKHISCGDFINLDVCEASIFLASLQKLKYFLLLKLQLINTSSILENINLLLD